MLARSLTRTGTSTRIGLRMASFTAAAVRTTVEAHPVVVFTKSYCGTCHDIVERFEDAEVPFTEVQLDKWGTWHVLSTLVYRNILLRDGNVWVCPICDVWNPLQTTET